MLWLAGIALALVLLSLLPLRLSLSFRQENWQALLTVEVRLLGLRLIRKQVSLSEKVAMAVEHMWKRWSEKGVAVKPDLQETIARVPRQEIAQLALPVLKRLGRATRCSRFHLRTEVGGGDAMESALLAGVIWSGAGLAVGWLSRTVLLLPSAVAVTVVPNYQRPLWRAELDCILAVRLGKAMVAIVGLLRQVLRRREVVAWVRDSLRRKGDQTSGRASDSGPHEDGHGEP